MRVLITGGSGFIGSAVSRELRRIDPGTRIRVLDISEPAAPDVEYIAGDVLDNCVVKMAMQDVTHVIHLAAMLGVAMTEENKEECIRTNLEGTRNVLQAASGVTSRRLVLASTSEVYGDQDIQPLSEDFELRPISPYGVSKLGSETLVADYRRELSMDWRVVRFFNIYGPGQRSEFVMPRFVDSVMRLERPTVYGDGSQLRSFCYVEDAARGCATALLADNLDEWIFNIGNNSEPIRMRDLAEKVIVTSGKRLSPRFVTFSESDRSRHREIWKRIPDTTRAKKFLNYEAKISLTEGIRNMFNGRANGGELRAVRTPAISRYYESANLDELISDT